MLILILDTETTGLDASKDTIIELASAVYDTESKSIISVNSFLVPTEEVPTSEITGITPEMTKLSAKLVNSGTDYFSEHLSVCRCIIAHNAKFDKAFMDKFYDTEPLQWVCSYEDIDWGSKATKLSYMCVDHGIPVVGAHRAISDVLMLSQLLSKVDNLEEQIEGILSSNKYEVTDLVSFSEKDKAKEQGFKWFPEEKAWKKTVRERSIAAVAEKFKNLFQVQIEVAQ